MITLRPARARGHAHHGWLDTYHSFSFADYFDPRQMGFRSLRVINEDRIAAARGFGAHPHRDMEILTVVLAGELEHRDSLGTGSVIRPGEVQRMSAGTGIVHSEVNPSPDQELHLLQIWLLPERSGIAPGYEQREFPLADRVDRLVLVASPDGREGSLTIHQDARVYLGELRQQTLVHPLAPGRGAWLQVVSGELQVNGQKVSAGDGLAIEQEERLELAGQGELLLFDLA